MPSNRDRIYFVIAEVERTGFVVGHCKKYQSAVELANELLLLGELFPWTEPEKIRAQLRNRNLREYRIKGNQIYFDKGIYGSADGKYAVAVLLADKDQFNLNVFIKERENYSIVFDGEQYSEKKWRKYFDDFPWSFHKAN